MSIDERGRHDVTIDSGELWRLLSSMPYVGMDLGGWSGDWSGADAMSVLNRLAHRLSDVGDKYRDLERRHAALEQDVAATRRVLGTGGTVTDVLLSSGPLDTAALDAAVSRAFDRAAAVQPPEQQT